MEVYGRSRRWSCVFTKLTLLCSILMRWSDGLMWIQPGMNHIVACCDVVSFNATKLEVENNRLVHKTVILKETLIRDLDDYQPPKLESTTLTLPAGAVVLPLVSSLHFQPHQWYNLCFKRKIARTADDYGSRSPICFPVRPCECDCDERTTDDSPWLRILVNASLRRDTIHLRLLSTFSPDTPSPLRVRFNLALQSERYYELCNKLEPPSADEEDEEEANQYRMRLRQCRREPPPIVANRINPSEAFQIQRKQVGGLPFYVLITINVTASRKYWAHEIVHKLDPIKVDEDENGGGTFGQWITVPVPTPRIEEHRPILDWDEVDAKRICPLIRDVDCMKSSTCSESGSQRCQGLFPLTVLIVISLISRLVDAPAN